MKRFFATFILVITVCMPIQAAALQMPQSGSQLATMLGVGAKSYIVTDVQTGQVLMEKDSRTSHAPASLTKLVTALVVLDTKPKLSKTVIMTDADNKVGGCGIGGVCIRSKAGVRFTVDGLMHAMLIPSANNAAAALARSTGLSAKAFAEKMNLKAASIGALNSHFNEPTGMDPENYTTAADFTKILTAAYNNPYLQKVAGLSSYILRSTNNSKYTQTLKNTDKLLADEEVRILIAKTGYLNESLHNFASVLKYQG